MKGADRHGFFILHTKHIMAYQLFWGVMIFHISSSIAIKLREFFVFILGFQSTLILLWAFCVFCLILCTFIVFLFAKEYTRKVKDSTKSQKVSGLVDMLCSFCVQLADCTCVILVVMSYSHVIEMFSIANK
jgi:hypothetical protein